MTLDELNAGDRDRFVDAVGWVVEDSPWVAERAWAHRPFATVDILHEAMTRALAEATPDEQLAVLRAHPDLGSRFGRGGPSGPPSNQADRPLTAASANEQQGAGLDALTSDEFERLERLNGAYRGRFGFPFLFAVKGSTLRQILAALDARLPRTRDEEFLEGLRQVSRIARFRLETALDGPT